MLSTASAWPRSRSTTTGSGVRPSRARAATSRRDAPLDRLGLEPLEELGELRRVDSGSAYGRLRRPRRSDEQRGERRGKHEPGGNDVDMPRGPLCTGAPGPVSLAPPAEHYAGGTRSPTCPCIDSTRSPRESCSRDSPPGWSTRRGFTQSFVTATAGSSFPEHQHPHEQVVTLLDGELELVVAGETHG